MKRIDIVTLFPEIFQALDYGITGRAIQQQLIKLHYWNPRDFTEDNYSSVDDKAYGGGPGMVMRVAPLQDAIHAAKQQTSATTHTIYLSPQGRKLDQESVKQLANRENLIMVCGRYEGVDERLLETNIIDEEWSVGDYVVTGGELPAMLMIDAITRLIPGALGDENSAKQDSFCNGLLDYPHYTRPAHFAGLNVPSILLSGNHQEIARWRLQQSLGRTWLRRPDLLANRQLNAEEQQLLNEFIATAGEKHEQHHSTT